MFTKEESLELGILTGAPMQEALQLWEAMYKGCAPWVDGKVKSLNLPASIASEMARLCTIELKSVVSGSKRGEFLNTQYQRLLPSLRQAAELGCAEGGIVFKPFVEEGKILCETVRANSFFPTAVDGEGNICSAIFADRQKRKDRFYTKLECHEKTKEGYVIQNIAFESSCFHQLGKKTALGAVQEWACLAPKVTLEHVHRPLFSYFKTPISNTIDSRSPLGVSVYSRAADLICEADKQFARLIWEFESGERALYVSDTAFQKDERGNIRFPDKRLYRALAGGEELYHDWSPTFREQSIINGLGDMLAKIEDVCGLARGTFSNDMQPAKTATEHKMLRQRSYATVCDTQKALRTALEGLIWAMDIWCSVYRLAPQGEWLASFEFDDSVVTDRSGEFAEKQQLVKDGIMQPWEFRAWYFGESAKQAQEALRSETE